MQRPKVSSCFFCLFASQNFVSNSGQGGPEAAGLEGSIDLSMASMIPVNQGPCAVIVSCQLERGKYLARVKKRQ